ncbi:hypothetical protein ACFQ88_17815 [Paenibacillus sp. NPDC056579]|uniref:hypothetical protein n=1 Tax=unclassified Paenibacillus TaxID=185978 RepID=UPI001EF84746|nr:hypothetical protein [Paenibacillus sp. H1-7]ULL17127.1 hypothetical protein DVH26_23395 [Paenibacillus sp. H1-7]
MRKWWILFLVIISVTACSPTASPADSAASKKVLFVGREGGGDALVVKRLKGLGYEVYVTADKDLTAEQALNHAFVFVSSTVNSGKVGNKLKSSPVPVIYAEGQNMGDVDLAGRETDVDHGNYNGKSIQVKQPNHPMAAGLKDSVDIYQTEGKIGFVVPGKEGVIVASAPDDERRAVICTFEKGAKNMNNEPVPARQVYFYLIGGEEINQTDNSWKLFDAAVRWITGK